MVNKRYQVALPFKSEPKQISLPSNFGLAWGRLRSTLNSLNKNPENLAKYNAIIKEQLDLGIIEPVKNIKEFSPPLHYLPHQPVIRLDKNKMRIVYDGSARESKNSPSLNDTLYPGPLLMNELIGVLLRFRLPKIVVVCDIAKAFLQIEVSPTHRDATRFLWVLDINKPFSSQNIQCYRFCRVSFGLTCSPYLLAATITHHLHQNPSALSKEIGQNIYVDNILFSAKETSQAQEKCLKAIEIFDAASMPLREFSSNESNAINHLPDSYRLTGSKQKFLGIPWETDLDEISLALNPLPEQPLTKRKVLAFFASHFDPLGLIGPLLLPTKIFMQSLWNITPSLGWDTELPPEAVKEWTKLNKIWNATSIKIPRRNFSFDPTNITFQLHAFSDASQIAFATAIYLRTTNLTKNEVETSLLFSKIKVKPKAKAKNSPYTIPRLELLGTLIATRALNFVQKHLSPSIKLEKKYFLWTDSSTVINWLNNTETINDIFVNNRIAEIRSTNNLIVQHVIGKENPADLATRGEMDINAFQNNSLWWYGPSWLTSSDWPEHPQVKKFSSEIFKNKIEKLPPIAPLEIYSFSNAITIEESVFPIFRFSRLPHLLRITTYALRFIAKIKNTPLTLYANSDVFRSSSRAIGPKEINASLSILLKLEQERMPPDDSAYSSLGIFKGNDLLLRCKGRMSNSCLPNSTKFPIYLPPHSELTKLIVCETHLLGQHTSPLQTLALIRRNYWIPSGRRTVTHILHNNCFTCRRYTAKPFDLPNFPPLPAERVNPAPPFTFVGLDFCGPIYVHTCSEFSAKSANARRNKKKSEQTKIWIAVFVCLVTRAIVLDIDPDLTTQSFFESLRRFLANYDPKTIFCDNAPTFNHTKKVLNLHAAKSNPKFSAIKFKFRCPMAAWKGGFYERIMAIIKHHLKRTLSKGIYPKINSLNSVRTCLTEITTIINSRPITFDSSNPADPRPLCPINFLQPLREIKPLPFPNTDALEDPTYNPMPPSDPSHLLNLWSKLSAASKSFWKYWKEDYLTSLRERYQKITQKIKNPH
uniref:Integrase catalytic domain-containing protein n=1 Tax=Meloidogyne enterolobii TaxID=390850 RepID=A0A6V7Y3A8_MELEN|nr:unnamed protein product [Meloidogyne enterolobii]